ncbi:uncharacterized protein [Typha angustifolia]|uniref:uncharacterized protein n=1 Tax=Typha angustifolia TaxID=59011 RepID=UPI003C2BB7B5
MLRMLQFIKGNTIVVQFSQGSSFAHLRMTKVAIQVGSDVATPVMMHFTFNEKEYYNMQIYKRCVEGTGATIWIKIPNHRILLFASDAKKKKKKKKKEDKKEGWVNHVSYCPSSTSFLFNLLPEPL